MERIWEMVKKVFCWLGTVFAAIFTMLIVRERKMDCFGLRPRNDGRRFCNDDLKENADEINKKAAAKREEAIERIPNADARSIFESYGSVCDTIADGKERFRRRYSRTDN